LDNYYQIKIKLVQCYTIFTVQSWCTKLWAQFSSRKFCKFFQDSPSHRMFERMHEILNIDKKIKLITQFSRNSRDESFEPN
jgi:hypothetical protein